MIKLVDIHKIYEDGNIGFLALKDINLDFQDDHFVCILGKSGSGKTTLLNIIGGLDNPSSGHMVINGELTTKFTKTQWDYFRNYKIGFIFQNFSLIEHLTVLDNVKLSVKLQGIKEEEAKQRALEMLKRVNILDQAYKLPSKLSGGQRQRVAIARALVNNPDVILADEPTGNLDKKTSKEVLEILQEISKEKLIIMVTHSKKIANTYADRIIELKDGSVMSDTKPYLNEKVRIVKPNIQYTKFRFIDKIKHAFKNIMMKKWRSFLISLGLAIGVSSFILIDGISNGIKINVEKYLTSQGNNPELTVYSYDEDTDLLDMIEGLEEIDDVLAVRYNVSNYLSVIKVDDVDVAGKYMQLTYKFTENKDEEYRLLGKPYGDGRLPLNDNEIMVSYNFASELYQLSNIENIWDKVKDTKITLVTEYYDEPPIYEMRGQCSAFPYIDELTPPDGYNEIIYGDYTEHIEIHKELYNKPALGPDHEIYICQDYDKFYKYNNGSPKSTKEFTIVGVNDSQFISESIITKSAYLGLFKSSEQEPKFNYWFDRRFDVYLTENGRDHILNIKNEIANTFSNIHITDGYNETASLGFLDIFVGMAQFIVSMILIVSVVTAGLMLLMILLISVMERSREIGILRSLGATRSDILSVFISESGVIGFIAGIFGIVLSLVVTIFGNMIIKHRYHDILIQTFNRPNVNIVILKPLSCIIGVIVCIFLAMLFGLIPAIKASKKTPINALKRL